MPPKTQNWAYSGLENKQTTTRLEIFMINFFLSLYFHILKILMYKITQIVQVNRSVQAIKSTTECLSEQLKIKILNENWTINENQVPYQL